MCPVHLELISQEIRRMEKQMSSVQLPGITPRASEVVAGCVGGVGSHHQQEPMVFRLAGELQ